MVWFLSPEFLLILNVVSKKETVLPNKTLLPLSAVFVLFRLNSLTDNTIDLIILNRCTGSE